MKKIAALVLSLVMLITIVPTAFAAAKIIPEGELDSITVDDREVDGLVPGTTVEVRVAFDVSDSDYKGKISVYDFDFEASVNNDDVEMVRVINYSAGSEVAGARVTLKVPSSLVSDNVDRVRLTIKMTPASTITQKYFRAATYREYLDVSVDEFDMDELEDAYEEMRYYEDDYMYFSPNVSFVSKDAVKFLRSKLAKSQYCYMDFDTYGIGISGATVKQLASKGIDFSANRTVDKTIQRVLQKADYDYDVEYLTFNSGEKLKATVRVGVNSDYGYYIYRYLGNNLFYEYKTDDSDHYDLEFDAYIMDTYIIAEEELPKELVYQVSSSATVKKPAASKPVSSTTGKLKLVLKKK